jgi:hypothetical protein
LGKIIIILVIISVIGIGIVFGIVYGVIPLHSEVSPVAERQTSSQTPSPVPSSTQVPSPSSVPPSTPIPSPSLPAPASLPPTQNVDVRFEFAVTDISGTGFSRTITAEITNTGNTDAHNVWGRVQVFSGDSLIKLDGKEFLRVDVGTIKAGETVTAEVTLSFGFTDGLKISRNGAEFVLNIYSDEFTDTFSYNYSP